MGKKRRKKSLKKEKVKKSFEKISETEFDETIINLIQTNYEKMDELSHENNELLRMHNSKNRIKSYGTHNIIYLKNGTKLRYDILPRECGFYKQNGVKGLEEEVEE